MGYQALLFCPDEKTARTVRQVLGELDFTVETSTEPFAAVKKLMAQRYDAVVVDCDNEQNATLLFKSARNSGSNQSSLAVAVVEGQAGVAKAFRIGANLVLTKPLNIEQAKGTLRVARGLLRKGSEASKAAPSAHGAPAGTKTSSPVPATPPASRNATPSFQGVRPTAPAPKPQRTPAPQPMAAPAMEVEDQISDAIVEASEAAASHFSQPQVPTRPVATTAPAASSKSNYPWQAPSKPVAEPTASPMRKAAEVTGKAPVKEPAATKTDSTPALANRPAPVRVSGQAGAAPAPAREIVRPSDVAVAVVATQPAIPQPVVSSREETGIAQPSPAKHYVHPDVPPPTFSLGSPDWDEEEGGSNKKALAIVAAVVILAATAGYLGWRNSNKTAAPPAATQTATPAAENSAPSPALPKPGASIPEPRSESIDVSIRSTPAHNQDPQPVKASPLSKAPAKEPAQPEPPAAETATEPLVVKRDLSHQAVPAPAAQNSEPVQPPSSLGLANSTDTKELAGISSAPVSVPKPVPQVVKISQGVSEGLVLKRVQPKYPNQAIQMRIQGPVQMQATISKEGNISNLKVLSGDGILARAAQDAVKQWKYKPYYLNGEPVEIQTLITVNFKLPN